MDHQGFCLSVGSNIIKPRKDKTITLSTCSSSPRAKFRQNWNLAQVPIDWEEKVSQGDLLFAS